MRCTKCNTICPNATKVRPRGQRYVIMVDCKKCGRSLHIEGVAQVTPPKVMK